MDVKTLPFAGALTLCMLTLMDPAGAAETDRSHPISGRFVVKLKTTARADRIQQSLASGQSIRNVSSLRTRAGLSGASEWNRWYVFSTGDSSVTSQEAATIIGNGDIEYIEPDYTIEFYATPNDSLFDWQWYLRNTGQGFPAVLRRPGSYNDTVVLRYGIPGADINLDPLYQSPPAEHTKVVVAIVDTGVDPRHPDLQGQFWRNPDEIAGNGIDDDHNGFVDDTLGYDVSGDIPSIGELTPDNDPTDMVGHGTHIAGIVAAAADDRGIVGVAPSAKIMAVKIRPNATTSVAASGIMYAVNAGAQVINVSWGTGYRSLVIEEALRIARLNGVFVAIAAGNTGDSSRSYPAFDDSAFAVAAGNADGRIASFSTWGPTVQLVAPGQDILSLRGAGTDLYAPGGEPGIHVIDSEYLLADGTSMAAPMVAGAAALIWTCRPDLNLFQLESILRLGATDLIDPLNRGDSLPGRDSISGYGWLDVSRSLSLLNHGGVAFVSPVEKGRYLDSAVVKIVPVAGYSGGWTLAWSLTQDPPAWQTLAQGAVVPLDSIAAIVKADLPAGNITLRLTDDYGTPVYMRFTLVYGRGLVVTGPKPNDTVNYFIPITGSAFGEGYDSVRVSYQFGVEPVVRLAGGTAEVFDTIIYSWSASGISEGDYLLRVEAFFSDGSVDSVRIPFYLRSAFAAGWPQVLSGRAGLTAVCVDLFHDGSKEVIAATAGGIDGFYSDGRRLPGFPALTDLDMRGIPAVHDIDHDGTEEIICAAREGLYVLRANGVVAGGWPIWFDTKAAGFGYPTVTVTSFGGPYDSVITLIDHTGLIRAYRLDGSSYFRSRYGWFTSFLGSSSTASFFNGNTVTAADLNGDGRTEVVASFYSTSPASGVAIYDGRTAQPAFGMPYAGIISGYGIFGTTLTDLNGDVFPEIISVGFDALGMRTLWVKTRGTDDLPGWPHTFPEVAAWRGNYPTVADLDGDKVPEILVTFFEFDIGSLYAFRADGTPFVSVPGRPVGELFRAGVTLSSPIVGDLTGDGKPEIVLRGGHIVPGAGNEMVYVLTSTGAIVPGWPVATPASPSDVFSTPFTPAIDDLDGDGLAELILISEPGVIYVWNFPAAYDSSKTHGRLLVDKDNTAVLHHGKIPTSVDDPGAVLPYTTALEQNYPNPFNPATTIEFSLPRREDVELSVYNVLGQRVRVIFSGPLSPGLHSYEFDGAGLASGTYFYKLATQAETLTRKMMLVK
ncbi:MAG: S8 family serine peptidase [candidate division Zixibacteria bacterium]|nr:S8 family serine peptidase [candidate division Zixibacteria bacterium]